MTPYEIKLLFHIDHIAEPLERVPILEETLLRMQVLDLIEADLSRVQRYRMTEKGKVYLKALCDMPLPIKYWKVPYGEIVDDSKSP